MKNLPFMPIAALVMLLLLALLYGPFIDKPPIFDDVYFFFDPQRNIDLSLSSPLDRRWVAMATLALDYRFWGRAAAAYNIGNLLLHFLTAFSLFVFIRDLLAHRRPGEQNNLPAFGAALLFALHPVAAFAAGYIVERSIVLAGLFSIWMWIAVHRGVAGERKAWLLLSVLFYYLALFSKEHAITALPVALLVAWNAAGGNLRKTLSRLVLPLPLWIATALTVVLIMKGFIGAAYEPLASEMLERDPHTANFLLRSIVNQGALFFKYALLWLLPMENWMSIDMREAFPPTWHAWPWIGGMAAYLAYPLAVVIALRHQYLSRLAGIGLLAPWLLFFTMFGAVLYQEPFVLYRSYLWALPATLLVALGLARMPRRGQIAALALGGLLCFGSTWSRLLTFSHPVLLWDEAATRLDGRDDLPGTYRIYHNRGMAYADFGDQTRALADYATVIAMNPAYPFVYQDRGTSYYNLGQYDRALSDFDRTLALKPDFARAYLGRGLTLLEMGRRAEALAALAQACQLGVACKRYQDEANKGATR